MQQEVIYSHQSSQQPNWMVLRARGSGAKHLRKMIMHPNLAFVPKVSESALSCYMLELLAFQVAEFTLSYESFTSAFGQN